MADVVKLSIDGMECLAEQGEYIIDAARRNGVYIPTLCNMPGVKPRGSCRMCNVKVNGRFMTSCSTPVANGMVIESNTKEIREYRRQILELLFVEGNHFCPSCERSGSCDLQALIYRFRVSSPRFPFQYPKREIDGSNPKLLKDHNRCVLCKRCIRAIKDEEGRSFFAFKRRGHQVEINMDPTLAHKMTDDLALRSMEACPVGALIRKEKGYDVPIGKRKYDTEPIGSDVERIGMV